MIYFTLPLIVIFCLILNEDVVKSVKYGSFFCKFCQSGNWKTLLHQRKRNSQSQRARRKKKGTRIAKPPSLRKCLVLIKQKKKTRTKEVRKGRKGEEQGSKSPFSLLSEPISPSSLNVNLTFSPSSLLFPLISPSSSQLFLGHFSLLPILFLPPLEGSMVIGCKLLGGRNDTWEVHSSVAKERYLKSCFVVCSQNIRRICNPKCNF